MISSITILILAAASPLSSALERIRGVDDLGEDIPYPKDLGTVFNNPTCKEYSMSWADRDFLHRERYVSYLEGLGNPNIGEGMNWGLHALQWKALQHASATEGKYDFELANLSNAPTLNPTAGGNHFNCQGAAKLDELEKANSGIFTTAQGSAVDPIGTWQCVGEYNALAAAILAAMNSAYWNTPTYVDTQDWKGDDGGVAVIEKVTLCVDGTEDPDVACNWWPKGSYGGTCGTSALVLSGIKLALFDAGGNYKDDTSGYVTADEWKDMYGKVGTEPVLVFDPPAGTTEAEIDSLKLQAENIADSLIDLSAGENIFSEEPLGGGLRG